MTLIVKWAPSAVVEEDKAVAVTSEVGNCGGKEDQRWNLEVVDPRNSAWARFGGPGRGVGLPRRYGMPR